MYNEVSIGIDQSYAYTGITVCCDSDIKIIRGVDLSKLKNNSKRRKKLHDTLYSLLSSVIHKAKKVICTYERIRLFSQKFISQSYLKSIGSLCAVIIDVCDTFEVECYSVDTRCWKSQVIGTSKPAPNKYNVPNEKWPTVRWLIQLGYEKEILDIITSRKVKHTFQIGENKYMYNTDKADSCGIAMYWFVGDRSKLLIEK